jgi:hypothetical protein
VRTILIRALLVMAGLAIVWLIGGRQLTLLIDRFKTVRVRSLPTNRMKIESGSIWIDESVLELSSTAAVPAIRVSEGPGNRITFGLGESTFAPDPGDEISLTEERSLLSWPTPLEMNFMTGHAPSWKRNQYYRLVWKKRSGARLELLWRYEGWFYSGLGGWSGAMTREGATGLIRADLRQ